MADSGTWGGEIRNSEKGRENVPCPKYEKKERFQDGMATTTTMIRTYIMTSTGCSSVKIRYICECKENPDEDDLI